MQFTDTLRRLIPCLVAAACLLFSDAACQTSEEAEPFRVALTGKFPPMSFYTGEGDLTGFDVEVSREISVRLGRPLEIVTTEWAGILAGLQAGRYDAIIGSMAITPERAEAVRFSEPYYISGAQLFVRETDREQLSDLGHLEGHAVGAVTGTTYQHMVEESHPGIDMRTYQGDPDIFQDMTAGRIDGFVTDRLVGLYNAKKAGQPFVPAGPLLYEERIAIPVTRDSGSLLDDINAALAEMEDDGTLDGLKRDWFGNEALRDDEKPVRISESVIARRMLAGFGRTLLAASVAIICGFLLAIPLGVVLKAAPPPIRSVLQLCNDFIRGTPLLVQLLFVYAGAPQLGEALQLGDALRLSPMQAGILTLTVNAMAFMAEVVRSGLLAVPPGQTTGAVALGLSRVQAFRHVVWPQAFRVMIPPLMNSVVALLKDTALLSVISVAEVITEAQKLISITFQPMKYYAIAAVLFFIVAFPLMKASQILENRIRRKGYEENA